LTKCPIGYYNACVSQYTRGGASSQGEGQFEFPHNEEEKGRERKQEEVIGTMESCDERKRASKREVEENGEKQPEMW
jgi:hypothetical protein